MINFFFKRKKIVIDAFTDHSVAYEHFPIHKSTSFLPNWWRRLPIPKSHTLENSFTADTNMRHCTGMIDIYRCCHILPMWTDVRILVDPKGEPGVAWQFADKRSTAGIHGETQHGTYIPKADYAQLKLMPPWVLESKENLQWIMFQPTYSFDAPEKIIVLPGMVDFRWDKNVNVQVISPRLEGRHNVVSIEAGTPLMAMLPMTDREVEFRHHHVTRYELAKREHAPVKFNGDGMFMRKLKQCPVNKE